MTFLKFTSNSLNFLEAATRLALGYRLSAIGYCRRVRPHSMDVFRAHN